MLTIRNSRSLAAMPPTRDTRFKTYKARRHTVPKLDKWSVNRQMWRRAVRRRRTERKTEGLIVVGRKLASKGVKGTVAVGKTSAAQKPGVDAQVDMRPRKKNPKAKLLGLPEELRNAIYEAALVEPQPIVVHSGLRFPAMLSVSRQIRSDAMPVWIKLNTFHVPIHRFDCAMLIRMDKLQDYFGVAPPKVSIQIFDSHNWHNLLTWCERAHFGRMVVTPTAFNGMPRAHAVASLMLKVTGNMLQSDWEDVSANLETGRRTLETFDVGWV